MSLFVFFIGFLKVAASNVGPNSVHYTDYSADDRWIWSIDNNTESSRYVTSTEPTNTNDYTKQPVFLKSGRRISEAKCLEYTWKKKYMKSMDKIIFKSEGYNRGHNVVGSALIATQAIGGRHTRNGEFPHMGAVGWRVKSGFWVFKCGCTLISEKFALTAAHCSKSPIYEDIVNPIPEIVKFGNENIDLIRSDVYPIDVKIQRIIVHPLYSSPRKYYDIALLELCNELSFDSQVQPACLWKNFDTIRLGTTATVTGWGVYELMSRKLSSNLQAAEVDIIDSWLCDWLMRPYCNRHWCGIQDHQICAGKLSGGVDACQGDSGGPLQVKARTPEGSIYFVIGVTSFGVDCAQRNLPGVYTRVSCFLDWIESVVWPENY